ncbi:MAG: chromosomal replication initiator protein DnaA, partial [Phycisphaerae bacterium]|nr:chromosomal replication initiator protein DnaA [Phycisphaerae bacterium]
DFVEQSSPTADSAPVVPAAGKQSEKSTASLRGNAYRVFSLDNFVVGECNRVAHAAAKMAVMRPGVEFNPLFIHGASGLGKTHLLQGILNGLKARHPKLRHLYLSAESFTNQFIMAMKTGSLDGFRHRHRNLDVLIIDDIHFLGGKTATQDEFLYTFNAFDTGGKLVILASDAHPREIGRMQQQLISRWVSGMVTRVLPPGRETREAIFRQKAKLMGWKVPKPVLEFLAERVSGSVRELEGALTKLLAYAALDRKQVSLSLAEEVLADLRPLQPLSVRVQDIEQLVCKFFGLSVSDIHSRRKGRHITLARHITMYLARKLTSMSFPEIGRMLGGKNHATVIAACKKIEGMAKTNQPLRWVNAQGQHEMLVENLLLALSEQLQP